jgi:hypothetical protein
VAFSFLSGKYIRLAGIYLFIFLIIIVLTIHLPAVIHSEGSPIVSIALTNLVKDTGLAGAALMIAAGRQNG